MLPSDQTAAMSPILDQRLQQHMSEDGYENDGEHRICDTLNLGHVYAPRWEHSLQCLGAPLASSTLRDSSDLERLQAYGEQSSEQDQHFTCDEYGAVVHSNGRSNLCSLWSRNTLITCQRLGLSKDSVYDNLQGPIPVTAAFVLTITCGNGYLFHGAQTTFHPNSFKGYSYSRVRQPCTPSFKTTLPLLSFSSTQEGLLRITKAFSRLLRLRLLREPRFKFPLQNLGA